MVTGVQTCALPISDPITGALLLGWTTLLGYLSQHVVTCLIPAFFIAGAIASFIKKEAILKYFSPETKKTTSYGIASVSGAVLAVCSCTILPMFAGILKKGSGLWPAITFLYAGSIYRPLPDSSSGTFSEVDYGR